ncbi:MAG: acylphosphatase [Elusimicrobiota bacterium]
MENKKVAKILIKGRVQMVGFRHFTRKNAQRMGVKGYVKNLPTGEVEAVAKADEETMEKFLKLLKRGPRSANVTDMDVEYKPADSYSFETFEVRF